MARISRSAGRARSRCTRASRSWSRCRSAARARSSRYLAPLLADSFGVGGAAFSVDNLYRQAIRVERGLIRVDADEVTYPLHVVLRYRLEKALVAGELEVADLPAAWNEGMRELLGVVPPDDRQGVLQDIHWPTGAIGYFPCYTLGAILAAQLYEAMIAAEPDLPAHVAEGDFRPLLAWLRANVHEQGARYETQELIARATGRPLELQPFLRHLETRYLALSIVDRSRFLSCARRSSSEPKCSMQVTSSSEGFRGRRPLDPALLCRRPGRRVGKRSASISTSGVQGRVVRGGLQFTCSRSIYPVPRERCSVLPQKGGPCFIARRRSRAG